MRNLTPFKKTENNCSNILHYQFTGPTTRLKILNFFIVSGLSGSGKSIALQALEDLGYYCIDNLPAVLLPQLAKQFAGTATQPFSHVAVSIDSRNRGFLETLPDQLQALQKLGTDYKILFLEAQEPILVKRYSETRRRHPLTDPDTPLLEGIRREKALLDPMSKAATRHIDTSRTTPQELRGIVRDFAGAEVSESPTLLFESFGYKHGTPIEADFVFDVRCLPNPYWEPELRNRTGLDPEVADFLEKYKEVPRMIEHIRDFVQTWLPNFKAENRSYITIAIGCTGGQHRSVYITKKLVEYFRAQPLQVQLRHRELS